MDVKPTKRERNRAHYLESKQRQDAALLRLDKGDLARFDAARSAAGLSRSAFATLYLLPVADALASRLADIERARKDRGISLGTFIAQAVDRALAAEPPRLAGASSLEDELGALLSRRGDARCSP